jgi:hypothetical protein
MQLRRIKGILGITTLALCAVTAAAAQDEALTPLRYERATRDAKLYNLASRDGAAVGELAKGDLVAVYEERSGFLAVDVPGGVGVWIYGEYARPTDVPGVVEITAQNINMRPLPTSDVSSFPLREKLHKGDRLRVITRANPDRPLAEDWIKVWSPAGTRVWLETGASAPLAAGEDGRALWKSAVAAAQAARPAPPRVESAVPADAPKPAAARTAPAAAPASSAEARDALAQAEELLAKIRSGESTDFDAARAAFRHVLDVAPRSAEAKIALSRLEEIDARADVVRLQEDMQAYEADRQEERARAEEDLRELQAKKDPLWGGRLQARGWLERSPDDPKTFVVRWGGEVTTELVCTSGRYDLDVFEGYEIGATGIVTRQATPPAIGQAARPERIDASRIEVISGRRQGR